MNIHERAKEYAEHLNMSVEQAEIRLEYFAKAKEKVNASYKCPQCGELTLSYEGGEWESGISAYIYCENDKIEKTDENGDKYFDECEFTDDVKNTYAFVFHEDFDVVLAISCSVDIHDEEAVMNYVGLTWGDFVAKDTDDLIKQESNFNV